MMQVVTYKCSNCFLVFDKIMKDEVPMPDQSCIECEHPSGWIKIAPVSKKSEFINICYPENVRVSQSLGVHPSQIEAAQKAYPGSEYNSRGHLIIRNRKEKLKRAKERGMQELD